jgi:tetratricopeptide (TPR) repeat protein
LFTKTPYAPYGKVSDSGPPFRAIAPRKEAGVVRRDIRKPVKALLGTLAASTLMTTSALADTKAGVDAWSRAEAARAAGDRVGANREYANAVREWQAQADKGDPDAQFNLGQAYKWGKGVPQDLTRAEVLFARRRAPHRRRDNYGLLLFQRGQHAQAIPYIQAAADRGENARSTFWASRISTARMCPRTGCAPMRSKRSPSRPGPTRPPCPRPARRWNRWTATSRWKIASAASRWPGT